MPNPVSPASELTGDESLAAWLRRAPFTLALSSSFFGFYAHCGIVTALYDAGFSPAKFSGASAGALVASWLAAGREPRELRDLIFDLKPGDFWDPRPGFGYLKGDKFRAMLRHRVGRYFWELRAPLEVAAYDIFTRKTEFLSDGSLPEAVSASCAVPIMFHPVRVKNKFYLDGGLSRKSGLHHERGERALCLFIESRVKGGGYERRGWPPSHENVRVWSFRDLPSVDYRRLETGRAAYECAYRIARERFAFQTESLL